MQNAGRIGGVLGDKTVVNLGCEEKKNDSSRLASHCAAEKRNQTGLDTHRGKAPVCCNPAMGWGMVVPLHVPILEIRPPEECTMEELMVEIFRRASKTINKNKLH